MADPNRPHAATLETLLADRRTWPRLMGVLNVTPDSFSDGGRHATADAAVAAAVEMAAAGADLIDIGGESTRPGSLPVPDAEQVARVVPVVRGIVAAGFPVVVSVDTTRAAVAAAALDAGATVVNDVSAGRDDPGLLAVVARARADLILMHMRGTPATMQDDPAYSDVVAEVTAFLVDRVAAAAAAGIAVERLLVDPGIGFGKTVEHNLRLMRALPCLAAIGRPVVLGTSRKGFIGRITGEPVHDRAFGTAATVAWAATQGVAIVRVHDVGPMGRVLAMTRALRDDGPGST